MAEDRPGYSFSPGPPPEASRWLRNKGMKPAFSWQDVEPEEHAVAFTVAKATSLDVLETIRGEVQRALDEGVPFAEFQKALRPRLEARGWWGRSAMTDPLTGEARPVQLGSPRRLRTIYEANIRTARAAGQWERIQRTKRGLPYLQYNLGPSIEHREEHWARAGLLLPVDHPSWDTWYPPNGWGCKCWVRQVTRAEAEDIGVNDDAPPSPTREVRNSRTGEVRQVPLGIDPGWERNPGKLRVETAARFMSERFEAADEAVARVAARDMRRSWAVTRLIEECRPLGEEWREEKRRTKKEPALPDGPKRFIPIGVLPRRAIRAMQAERRGVILSGYNAAKQACRHPEVRQEDYDRLEALLEDGEMRENGPGSVMFVQRGTKQTWVAVIKALPNGENFLQTLYRNTHDRWYDNQVATKPLIPEE